VKIVMWSGPRNLSTAMMYAFGTRPDFAASDEPFYAAYLAATRIDHPMREEVIAAGEADPERVASTLAGKVPGNNRHWYQKHMAMHMIAGFPLDWAADCVNVHLIRHPARVIASYTEKRERPTLDDIAFHRQVELYARFPGPVLDSADIRANPRSMLERLCAEIGLDFRVSMLSWPAGPKPFDGVWASHWYDAVHRSTGFAGSEGPLPHLSGAEADLAREALPFYDELAARRLT
jgi:hypothetical protein